MLLLVISVYITTFQGYPDEIYNFFFFKLREFPTSTNNGKKCNTISFFFLNKISVGIEFVQLLTEIKCWIWLAEEARDIYKPLSLLVWIISHADLLG